MNSGKEKKLRSTKKTKARKKNSTQKTASSSSKKSYSEELFSSHTVDLLKSFAEQAKEPLSLLEQLKEEGLARAGYLLGVASGVASNLTKSSVRKQLKEISDSFGIATRDDIEWIESRLNDLESRLEALEKRKK